MQKTKPKRLLSMLLILCMVLTLIPITAVPAFAAGPASSVVLNTTSNGNQTLDSGSPYLDASGTRRSTG